MWIMGTKYLKSILQIMLGLELAQLIPDAMAHIRR